MITGLTIENFRGIRKASILKLSKINVFVGRNNAGKSTILEALYFVKAHLRAQNDFNERVLEELLERRVARSRSDVRELTYGYGFVDTQIRIQLEFGESIEEENNQNLLTILSILNHNKRGYESQVQGPRDQSTPFLKVSNFSEHSENYQTAWFTGGVSLGRST